MFPQDKHAPDGRKTARSRKQMSPEEIAAEKLKLKPTASLEQEVGTRIKKLRENMKMTQAELTRAVDYSRAAAAQWERGESTPPLPKLVELAKVLNARPEFLAFGLSHEPVEVMPSSEKMGFALVPEIVITDGPEDAHEVMKWGLPFQWLRSEMQIDKTDDLCIYKVQVDDPNGKFNFGDRVVVDRSQYRPSPPGNFLMWDGVGAQLAHINVIPAAAGKMMAKVTMASGSYEVDVTKIKIIGRVKGVWKKA